jgi:hypothetical protein
VDTSKLPEGPALPKDFENLKLFFVGELNTADDLFKLQLSPTMAQFGGGSGGNTQLDPATFFNTLVLIDNIDVNTLPAAAGRAAAGEFRRAEAHQPGQSGSRSVRHPARAGLHQHAFGWRLR